LKGMLLLLVMSLISPLHSEAQPIHDYMFSVTGIVTAEDGTPIQDAQINLEVDAPVYEGVALVKTVKRVTNDTGGFVFVYTTHKRGVKYTLTVHKEGFESQSVSGKAPPPVHHTIRLKRAGADDVTPRGE
jgi:hypothetical protein